MLKKSLIATLLSLFVTPGLAQSAPRSAMPMEPQTALVDGSGFIGIWRMSWTVDGVSRPDRLFVIMSDDDGGQNNTTLDGMDNAPGSINPVYYGQVKAKKGLANWSGTVWDAPTSAGGIAHAKFSFTLDQDGKSWSGTWTQISGAYPPNTVVLMHATLVTRF